MLEVGPKFTDPPVTALTKLSLKHRKTCDNKLNSVGSSDLSSDEVEDIGQLREERRDRKRQKRKDKLKKCCSGCDEDLTLGDVTLIQAGLPSPLEINNGERPSEVIAPFESVLSAVCDSEEEIDAQIEAYSSVGLRLARGDDGLSDVEQPMNEYYPACGTPSSDSDVVTTHISNSVGKKLAKTRSRNSNRTDSHTSSVLDADFDFEGEDDMWGGGFDYQDELSEVDEAGDSLYRKSVAAYEPSNSSGSGSDQPIEQLTISQLGTLTKHLHFKLQVVNQELVRYIQERDSLTYERDVILNHIEELTSLAQGRKSKNPGSAFRKIVIPKQ